LIEIARFGVINGRPQNPAQIAAGAVLSWSGREGLNFIKDAGGKIGLETFARHLRPRSALEIEFDRRQGHW
jgi:hypothetical protein